MRRRCGAWIGVALVVFAALCECVGCGDDTRGSSATGATADGGEPSDRTIPPGPEGDDASPVFADATASFEPTDSSSLLTPPEPCTDGTTLSGTVYDPAGVLPLENALVYVPSDPTAPLSPLTTGLTTGTGSCSDSCDPTIGTYSAAQYVAVATTDLLGAFTLDNVPSGKDIPLVIQLGKWRRRVTLDVQSCANTKVPASLSRLPRSQGEGDLPQMALVTGACDELACLLRHIGLDGAEFTGPTGGGRVHVYKGAGAAPDLADGGEGPAGDCSGAGCPLWSTKATLEKYDLVLLGCECGEHNETKPDMGPMHDWLDEGGRLLATHYQDTWFKNGPADFQGIASWESSEADGPTSGPFQVDTSFSAGNDLRNWLGGLGAFNADGSLTLPAADVSTSLTEVSANTVRWIYDSYQLNAAMGPVPKLFSFETPVGGVPPPADGGSVTGSPYCGRAFFTDVHAGGGGVASSSPVPGSCTAGDTSAEEKVLEYAFFDLSGSCWVRPPPHP